MRTFELRQIYFPYCIQKLADGRYIVLNRNYKPLGDYTSAWVKYEEHHSAMPLKITPAIAKKLSFRVEDPGEADTIYLYNDGCKPTDNDAAMKEYLARLAVLMKLQFATDRVPD